MTITTGPSAAPAAPPVEATGRRSSDRESSDRRGDQARFGGWQTVRPGTLTGPSAALLGIVVTGLGALADRLVGDPMGVGFAATFLVASVVMALTVRPRSLLTAAALPPVLYAGMVALAVKLGGETQGTRELGLDVATTLALSAPVIFAGTAAATVIALVRALVLLSRRWTRPQAP